MKRAMAFGTLENFAYGSGPMQRLDPRVKLICALGVILSTISLPSLALAPTSWHLVFPVIALALADIPPALAFKRLLPMLPFIVAVGIWAPLIDTHPVPITASLSISRGWFQFATLMTRALVAVGSLIVLTGTTHLGQLSSALRWLRVPNPLILLILLIYRYFFVLFDQGQTILLAGRLRQGPAMPSIGQWGALAGTLFGRTVRRATRVQTAMELRGFDGSWPTSPLPKMSAVDLSVLAGTLGALATMQLAAHLGFR